jgi:hypothetical protein
MFPRRKEMVKPLALRVFLLATIAAFCFSCATETAVSNPTPVDQTAAVSPAADSVEAEKPVEEKVEEEASSAQSATPVLSKQDPADPKPAMAKKTVVAPEKTAKLKPAPAAPTIPEVNDATVVASIADWTVTGKELRDRIYTEVYPDHYDMTPRIKPVDSNEAVLLLLGEKALAMEAHKLGKHKEGTVATSLERYRTSLLINQLMSQVIKVSDVQVSDAEVKAFQQIKPELDDARAKTMLMKTKAQKLGKDFITKLYTSRHSQKKTENIAKAAQMHQRLLLRPKEPRANNISWILRKQIQNELTPDERKIVLATYDGGVFTVEDWFSALHQMAPPGRPKNLGTAKGAEQFLDKSLRQPLLRAEAIERGLDKDAKFIKSVREREYRSLINLVRSDMTKAVPDPNDQEIAAHYAAIKDRFGREDSLKAQLIWCENETAAHKAKAELDQGQAFADVQAKYAIDKKNLEPRDLSLRQEGIFWEEIWTSEPNQILGPILGFQERQFRWRIIKTLEKQPKGPKDLDDNIKSTLKWEIRKGKVDAQLRDRMRDVLKKYPHKVFKERLTAFEPGRTP